MIPLYVDDGIAYVWNAEDWHTLRAVHRISGSLIGSTPSFPRQNEFSGLPMALTSEEAALLVERGIGELVKLSRITTKPTEDEKEEIKALHRQILLDQAEAMKLKKTEQLSQKIDIILSGKRQKLIAKGVTDVQIDKQTLLQEEINKLQNLAPAHTLVHLPTEHYKASDKITVPVDVLKPSVSEGFGAVRYSIFKDLWQQGYHITDGSKFGSHFLVYPGDPVKFHAMYMVRCVPEPNMRFSPASIVAFGRLSVAVNKLAVLASCNIYGNNVEYQTLEWHDNS